MEYLVAILVPIACGCVLPIMVVWLAIRKKMNETNQRTQIVLAAIEKNPDMDIEELMKKISPKKKLLKEKLLTKLLWGSIITFLGVALIGFCIVQAFVGGMPTAAIQQFSLFGAVLSGIGIAFLVNYYIGKRMLAKEMEAEEQLLVMQAENK
ncbi:MAG: hypothetical protein IJ066_06515 [Bacteroidaceae bacterium]|nr:hypothetical protein [Bacteroidaceae bacterium]MBQ9655298.1 hypothetical protein [Prevotella sp.]